MHIFIVHTSVMHWGKQFFLLILTITSTQKLVVAQYDEVDSLFTGEDSFAVKAYYASSNNRLIPASIGLLNKQQLQQFSTHSLVPVFNTVAGVRMEERSPGSYRLSVRGSLLRSPFGVRNVKVYWNNFPLTDGSGNTYLNLVELAGIDEVEMVKGPAGVVYGSGTGGAILLKNKLPTTTTNIEATVHAGSFGLLNQNLKIQVGKQNQQIQILQSHIQSNGYRQNTALNKNTLQVNACWQWGSSKLSLMAFNTNLFYQTPGGLTLQQFLQNPKLARLATNTLPSAIEQQASISNHTTYAGINYQYNINANIHWQIITVYSKTSFSNPFITNYEIRDEHNYSTISTLNYHQQMGELKLQYVLGVEWLRNNSSIQNFTNNRGTQGNLQFDDVVKMQQLLGFGQLQIQYKKFLLQSGLSINEQWLGYNRKNNLLLQNQQAYTKPTVLPRLAVSYNINKHFTAFAQVSKGFSPPSLAEYRPSDGNFYNNLQPEFGYNVEGGLKANWQNRARVEIAYYNFRLQNAIVRRVNNLGAEYFINAGSVQQNGIECSAFFMPIHQPQKQWLSKLSVQYALAYQPYYFIQYTQGNQNYNGNKVTGVPQQTHAITVVAQVFRNISCTIMHQYVTAIALNDANDEWAKPYNLVQAKITMNAKIFKVKSTFFSGVDNLLNEQYSLGNDINAVGRRYYNAAPSINFFAGLTMAL